MRKKRGMFKEVGTAVKDSLTEIGIATKKSFCSIKDEAKTIPKMMKIEAKYSKLVYDICDFSLLTKEETEEVKKTLFDKLLELPDELVNDETYVKAKLRCILHDNAACID